jgi:hypothetical protein
MQTQNKVEVKQSVLIILILFFSLFIASFIDAKGQTVQRDANGNFRQISAPKEAKTETAKNTGKTFTDTKGNVYPVMISKNGKLFYVRTSKSGNDYKVYIKIEG